MEALVFSLKIQMQVLFQGSFNILLYGNNIVALRHISLKL